MLSIGFVTTGIYIKLTKLNAIINHGCISKFWISERFAFNIVCAVFEIYRGIHENGILVRLNANAIILIRSLLSDPILHHMTNIICKCILCTCTQCTHMIRLRIMPVLRAQFCSENCLYLYSFYAKRSWSKWFYRPIDRVKMAIYCVHSTRFANGNTM